MRKVQIEPQSLIYPMPALLIGAVVGGRVNFMTAAWCGVANSSPPMVSVAIQPGRFTFAGIRENRAFSVNVPSASLVRETDYCGIVSGSQQDKTAVCAFRVFFGKLDAAPLIEQCPVNLACSVAHELELGSHVLFVGRIEETHVSEDCLTEGKPDIKKIQPILFSVGLQRKYWGVGEALAPAFRVGMELKK